MTAQAPLPDEGPDLDALGDLGGEELLTIDELAAATGTTVRTTRYYASLGLIPAPVRRGRVGYYGPVHRAWLELVRALQDHGYTLQAIEGFVRGVPDDAGVEELALQRVMLTSWTAKPPEQLTRRQLERRAGRPLSDDDLEVLRRTGCLEERDDGFLVWPHLEVGLELLSLNVPLESLSLAEDAIGRHMGALADELTTILHEQVLRPYRRSGDHSPSEAARLEQTVTQLRRLTLESVVTGFQRAANAVITRSLSGGR